MQKCTYSVYEFDHGDPACHQHKRRYGLHYQRKMPYTPGRDGTLVLESVPDVGEAATIPFDEKPRTSHVESEPSAHWMHCMHLGAVSTGMVLMELVPSDRKSTR